jgi:hypothetical protein
MCFYDQQQFSCGDWRWGRFRQHCYKECQIGETCGKKLVMQVVDVGTQCNLCERSDTKMKKRTATVERITCWQARGSKSDNSIGMKTEYIKPLDGEIYELGRERNMRLQILGDHEITHSSSISGSNPDYKKAHHACDVPAKVFPHIEESMNRSALQEVGLGSTSSATKISTPSVALDSTIIPEAKSDPSVVSVQDESSDKDIEMSSHKDKAGNFYDQNGVSVNDGLVEDLHLYEGKPELGDNRISSQTPRAIMYDSILQLWKSQHRLVKKTNAMYGLPITFEGDAGPTTVMAVPDSGSSHNIMSLKLALHLGLRLEWQKSEKTEIMLLDGSAAICTSVVQATCRFARTFSFDWKMRCTFLVLPSLVEDLIMSASFLHKTATFTKFRNRLVQLSPRMSGLPRVCALGAIRQRLRCCIAGEAVAALPDSGSDVDIVSLEFATKREFKWYKTCEQVVFADGRTKTACGKFVAPLSLGAVPPPSNIIEHENLDQNIREPLGTNRAGEDLTDDETVVESPKASRANLQDACVRHVIRTTFYVLDGITVDALIGAKSIESLQVYTHNARYLSRQEERDIENRNLYRITLGSKVRNCVKTVLPSSRRSGSEST